MQRVHQLLVVEEALRRLRTWLDLPHYGSPYYFLYHPLTPLLNLQKCKKKRPTSLIERERPDARWQLQAMQGGLKVELEEVVVQAVIKP